MKLKELLQTENGTVEKKREFKNIPIDKLDSMLDYQRDIDMAFVERKSSDEEFDEKEISTVLISAREDGSFKICDGQHTVAILKRRGYTEARCEIRYGLTVEEENDWFNVVNTKGRPQNKKSLLTSAINGTYEKHRDEHDFYNCIKSLGFKLNIYGEKSGNDYKINCPDSLLKIYIQYSSEEKIDKFVECLDLIKTCFNGDPISLQWNFIRGTFDFYEVFDGDFEQSRFVKCMTKITAHDIKKDSDNYSYIKKPSLRYAMVFAKEYNSGLSKGKRLKISHLEE